MKRWEQKKHTIGFCFLLLLVGAECTRVIENIERHGRIAREKISRAQQQQVENPEDAAPATTEDKLETPEGELARGLLHFRKETGPCFAIMRSGIIDDEEDKEATVSDEDSESESESADGEEETEGGSMTLDLYPMALTDDKQKESLEAYTLEDFKAMKPLPKKWPRSHRIILRHDDMALIHQDNNRPPALKVMAEHTWLKNWEKTEYGSKREELDLSTPLSDEHQIIFLKGSGSWYEIENVDELLKSWTTAIRTLQTSNTCLERGTCVMQCTYIPSQKACNSPEFCQLVDRKDKFSTGMLFWKKDTRKRCEGIQGVTANKVAWGDMTTVGRQKAMEIGKRLCVYNCGDLWTAGNEVKQMALSMFVRFKEALADPTEADKFGDMAEFMKQVIAEAPGTAEYITEKMGIAWDAKRKESINDAPLARVMKDKGCGKLEDGSLQAINAAAFDPDNEELDKQVNKFQEQCPLYSDAETEDLDTLLRAANTLIQANRNEGHRDDEWDSLMQLSKVYGLSGSSFIQENMNSTNKQMVVVNGKAIPLIIWAIGAVAIVSAAIGVTLFLSSRRCAQKESGALKRCRQQFLEEPSECDKDFSMGMWFTVAGGVLMVATLSAVVFTGAAPALTGVLGGTSAKAIGSKVASHVAGTAAWKAMQYTAKQESIKSGVTKYLQKSSMVVGAYLWSKCKKEAMGGPPSEAQRKLWKLQQANFRTCMVENGEPVSTAQQQIADKMLVESASLDALKAELKEEEGPTAGDIVSDLTKSAWKQVVEWPGKKDFAVDLMKILTENKQVVNIPGIGELPMEIVLSMAESKIQSNTLVAEGEEAVEVPGFGKLPVKLLVLLNKGKEDIDLPGIGKVKLTDLIEHMRKPTPQEMDEMPILLSRVLTDPIDSQFESTNSLVGVKKAGKTEGQTDQGKHSGEGSPEDEDDAHAASMKTGSSNDKGGAFLSGPSSLLIAFAAILLALRGEC